MSPPLVDKELPDDLIHMVQRRAGRAKLVPFATRLCNFLWQCKGSALVSEKQLLQLLQRKSVKTKDNYITILVEANVIRKGTAYSTALHRPKRYTLTAEAKELMRQRDCVEDHKLA